MNGVVIKIRKNIDTMKQYHTDCKTRLGTYEDVSQQNNISDTVIEIHKMHVFCIGRHLKRIDEGIARLQTFEATITEVIDMETHMGGIGGVVGINTFVIAENASELVLNESTENFTALFDVDNFVGKALEAKEEEEEERKEEEEEEEEEEEVDVTP